MTLKEVLRSSLAFAASVACAATVAFAGNEFGTREEAEALADQLIEVINREGIEAAVRSMHDPSMPFVSSRMGVNLFQGSVVIADNREPETVAADYSTTADLTGELVWPRIRDAAEANGEAMLAWYHYDTQDAYDYHCLSRLADRDEGLVMVCR